MACEIIPGTNENHFQGECIIGGYVNGTRQPVLKKFGLEKLHGYKISETAVYRVY